MNSSQSLDLSPSEITGLCANLKLALNAMPISPNQTRTEGVTVKDPRICLTKFQEQDLNHARDSPWGFEETTSFGFRMRLQPDDMYGVARTCWASQSSTCCLPSLWMARKLGWSSSAVAGQGPNSVNSSGFTLALTDTERAHAWKAGPQTSSQSHDTLLHYSATHYTNCKATLSRRSLWCRVRSLVAATVDNNKLHSTSKGKSGLAELFSSVYPIEMSFQFNTRFGLGTLTLSHFQSSCSICTFTAR